MTLVINIIYSGQGDNAKKFAQEMLDRGVVDRIRQQPGNLRYDYFIPLEDPESLLLIDTWTDQAALDAHHKSPMMAEIAELRAKYKLRMKVDRYLPEE
ncbi:putative quinol monooxygenase [Aerococcus sanguinicola]|uniref:Antibiotic biosynthesis monooxygenase n=1 Tax=Aerococcus sanguinicola TaxID=119206 RepID=A0A2I1MQA7_9LACT|nr:MULTISPECIES: putative quinol monooxygenase [Aerococcus]MDK7050064.1 putative quinol monooxygenase [Aerococcus sanguinicola]OFT93381.1 antibiotic biosynthesis monooxygenase [Aerococcus sp. HMSC23C02]PKZ22334.1 antibiotic biosynthesis monooxygenase [Aerococcus sanguinicola]